MIELTKSLELADAARAKVADLLDLQLSPLGLAAEPRVRAALSARRSGAQVRLGAATWIVTAVAG
jgi:hypothetical protein